MALSKIKRGSLSTGIDDNSDATAITIDSSERVSIGTTSPHTADSLLTLQNGSGVAELNITSGTSGASLINLGDTGDYNIGRIKYNQSDNSMQFNTQNAERMRIINNGQVLIGATSTGSSTKLHVTNNNYLLSCHNNGGTSGYFGQIQFLNNADNSTIGSIIRTNNSSVSYNTTSDARLKENVADMTDGITKVKQLTPKRFSWIDEDLDAADQDGFLAHEAQAVVPGCATGTQNEVDDDGNPVYMQMDAAKLVPVLTAALKESIAKIETLETEMTALKARVTTLENA